MTATHFAKAKSALQVGKGEHGTVVGGEICDQQAAGSTRQHVKLEKLSNESIEWPSE